MPTSILPFEIFSERLVFLFGAPRSGTTWIGKIFDSHPDVIYRHEPDLVTHDATLPWICLGDDAEIHRERARGYVKTLAQPGTLKTTGLTPVFRKRGQGAAGWIARMGTILLLQGGGQLSATQRWARSITVPDFLPEATHPLRIAIKSVSALGRARLYANAAPNSRIVLIVRDPRAQVASMLRGISLNKFDREQPVAAVLVTPQAKRYGLDEQAFDAMTLEEQLTWNWVIMYEKAIDDLANFPQTHVIRYDDFVKDPLASAKHSFDFAGLPWDQKTEKFILDSSHSKGKSRYYGVYQNPDQAANSWRQELSDQQKDRIRAIVESTSLASFLQQ